MSWIEDAPRATKFQIAGATVATNQGPLPVMSFAFETMDTKLVTVSFISSADGLKKFKSRFLRAYDEALREAATIERSLRDAEDEEKER